MIKDGWYYCTCGQKVFKVLPTTKLVSFPCYCKKCKTESIITISVPAVTKFNAQWKESLKPLFEETKKLEQLGLITPIKARPKRTITK